MPHTPVRAALVSALVAVLVAWPVAQQRPVAPASPQNPVFKSASDLVEVDATVTDKDGNIVRGLTRDDFIISEDDTPQPLVEFSFIDIPAPVNEAAVGKTKAPAPPPDVASNAHPQDSRLYVVVLDGFHIDATRSAIVRKQARQFITDYVGPDDLVAVLTLAHGTASQQFTSSKPLMFAAIDQFIGQKSQSAELNKIGIGAAVFPGDSAEDPETGAKASEAKIALESVAQLCQRLSTTEGHRRSIVYFSEGIELDTTALTGARPGSGLVHEPSAYAEEVLNAEREMFEAAERANVALYTVDPRGSTIGEDTMMKIGPVQRAGGGKAGAASTPFTPPTLDVMTEVKRGQGTLRTFAEETGGIALVNTDNYAAGFTRIVQANSSYYALAYMPSNLAHDGTYRKISVKLKLPHLDVVARKGYYAPDDTKAATKTVTIPPASASAAASPNASAPAAGTPSTRMKELLASQLPVSGLGLRIAGGPVRSQGDNVLVALVVELSTKDLPFLQQDGQLSNDIELAYLAQDSTGKTLAANSAIGHLRLPPEDRAEASNGLRYVAEFVVPPGRYQVRVGAHESAGDSVGSALLDVEALTLAKTPLSVGTIMLTTAGAISTPTTGSYPWLKAALPTPPTTRREFVSGETVMAFASVCDADAKSHTVDITTRVQTADGREVFRGSVTKPNTDLAPATNGFGYLSKIPLSGIAPGRYVLTIEAKSTTNRIASASLAFVIR